MKDFLTIGDKGMLASLGVWGLLLLSILAIVITVVASVTSEPETSRISF